MGPKWGPKWGQRVRLAGSTCPTAGFVSSVTTHNKPAAAARAPENRKVAGSFSATSSQRPPRSLGGAEQPGLMSLLRGRNIYATVAVRETTKGDGSCLPHLTTYWEPDSVTQSLRVTMLPSRHESRRSTWSLTSWTSSGMLRGCPRLSLPVPLVQSRAWCAGFYPHRRSTRHWGLSRNSRLPLA